MSNPRITEDQRPYYRFTGRQRFDRAIHTLEGMVKGIGADGHANEHELAELMRWVGEHREFASRHPFNEVIPVLNKALSDGVFDREERYDILWLCDKLNTNNDFYCTATADMQRLQGVLAGIIADKDIEVHELELLQGWIDQHDHLKCCWPYDELEAILAGVMKDGVIDDSEHAMLMEFFREFTSTPGHRSLASEDKPKTIQGVCAMCPDIVFEEKWFCFTGSSKRALQKDMEALATERGGRIAQQVSRKLHYLVIGADGNPCWAYACYGRKVDDAMKLRKQGLPVVLVHEHDFWDAVG